MADTKPKNRRYRGSKISEYKLRRVVECFAKNMTVKDTAKTTRISPQSINAIFMRIRERMRDHGLFRFNKTDPNHAPAKAIFGRKHRGVPTKYDELYEIEFIHRVLCEQQPKGFQKLSASKDEDIAKARRLHAAGKKSGRHVVIEVQNVKQGEGPRRVSGQFDPLDFKEDSELIVNERHMDPEGNFFRYLWALLLRHPL